MKRIYWRWSITRFPTQLTWHGFLVLRLWYRIKARVMKLVDMLGLKPRPLRGPGSTPGTGKIVYIWFVIVNYSSLILAKLYSIGLLVLSYQPLHPWIQLWIQLINQTPIGPTLLSAQPLNYWIQMINQTPIGLIFLSYQPLNYWIQMINQTVFFHLLFSYILLFASILIILRIYMNTRQG